MNVLLIAKLHCIIKARKNHMSATPDFFPIFIAKVLFRSYLKNFIKSNVVKYFFVNMMRTKLIKKKKECHFSIDFSWKYENVKGMRSQLLENIFSKQPEASKFFKCKIFIGYCGEYKYIFIFLKQKYQHIFR